MDSTIIAVLLPACLALVMLGLGLTLTVGDFTRVLRYPKAAVVSLACQMVLLPVLCVGLIFLFGLQGALAVGMMILVASPGGTTASVFSHLAGGDVALNVTLTAINSVLAVFTLPVVVGLSVAGYLGADAALGLQPAKFLQVVVIVVVPVLVGMVLRHRFTAWALRMRGPVKVGSLVVLVLAILAALLQEFDAFLENLPVLGPATLSLSVLSLAVGYWVPRLFRVNREQAIASAMEIGIHNAVLAIAIATTVLGEETMAFPAGMYGIVMFLPAALLGYAFARLRLGTPTAGSPS